MLKIIQNFVIAWQMERSLSPMFATVMQRGQSVNMNSNGSPEKWKPSSMGRMDDERLSESSPGFAQEQLLSS